MIDEVNEEMDMRYAIFTRIAKVAAEIVAFQTEHKAYFAYLWRKYEKGELDLNNRITEGNKWQADMLIKLVKENGWEDLEGFDQLKYSSEIFEQWIVFQKELFECRKILLEEQRNAVQRIVHTTLGWIRNAEAAVAKDPETKENKKLKKDIQKVKKGLGHYQQSLTTLSLQLATMQKSAMN